MFHLACTRFNNQTYQENKDYRLKSNEVVIYGPAFKIRNIYSPGVLMFVFEMNNETNHIEGIGLITNTLVVDKRHKIYENNDYNRITYRGKYWLSRNQIEELDPEINEIFDLILFKGKSNMKRLSGITVLTNKLFKKWDYDMSAIKNRVKNMFKNHYIQSEISETETSGKNK
jgi:hypothetical protein